MAERFRKKPVEIDAVRWTGDNEMELIAFTGGQFMMLPPAPYPPHLEHLPPPPITAQVYDELHSTWVGVETGQWVIEGVKGEFHPIAADVLAETYEPVKDGPKITVHVQPDPPHIARQIRDIRRRG